MSPASLVTETEKVERANGEDVARRRPRDGGDHVVVRCRTIEETAVRVPDLYLVNELDIGGEYAIFAVFASGNDEVICDVPIGYED